MDFRLTSPCIALSLAVLLLAVGCEENTGTAFPDHVPSDVVAPVQTAAQASASEAAATPSADAVASAGASADDGKDAPDAAKTAAGSTGAALASAAPEPEEPAGKVKGDEKAEATYGAWLQSAGRYVAGKPAAVQAVLVAKNGYKCNDKYPYKFKLGAAPEGVNYPEPIARNISIGKERSVLTVPFVPSSAGAKTISGTFYFSVCDDTTCKIKKAPMSVTVQVNES